MSSSHSGPSISSQHVSIGAGARLSTSSGNVSIGAGAGPSTSSGNISIGLHWCWSWAIQILLLDAI